SERANGILMRGFAAQPDVRGIPERYGLRAGAVATYPMYRGLARLVGMDIAEVESGVAPQFDKLKELWEKYNYYFVHIKYTDSFGEDGNFDKKVSAIEEVDKNIDRILNLNPDVFIVTTDHSTPAISKSHSWHPVPVLIHSRWSRKSNINEFGETQLLKGTLGIINSLDLMMLVMAHSGRLAKFGA
ncbi:hypothetical protein LCGC14_1882100, partial [marine sediment metagenome]